MPIKIKTDEYDLVNRNTGWKKPIEAGSTVSTPEDKFYAQERREQERKKRYRRTQTDELGNFVLLRVRKLPVELDPATLARLTLLSTYLDYQNRLMLNERVPMRKTDLPKILNLSERAAKGFVAAVQGKFMFVRDGDLYLSKEYYKGESEKYKKDQKQRLFIKSTRELYYALKPTHHKYFGYIVKLVPFINREFNVLCHNADEVVYDRIAPLTIGEICDILDYDSTNSARLLDALTGLLFTHNGESQSLCAIVKSVGNGVQGYGAFINPRIIYNGSDYKQVEVLHHFFPMKNRCYNRKTEN